MENIQDQKTVVGFRLSPLQQRLWKLLPQSSAFGAQAIIQIDGELSFSILQTAIQDVVARHEILRTTFQPLPAPVQVIATGGAQFGRHHDWRNFSEAQQSAALTALFEELKAAPFDLNNGLLLRLASASSSAAKHFLFVALPALCADAIGLNNLAREISRAYRTRIYNEEYSGEVAQYADIAEWQNDLLEGEAGEAGRAFWRKQNFYPLPPAQLPFAKPEAAESRFQPQAIRETMRAELAEKIFTLAKQRDTSVATILLAGFKILLWRLTGGESEIIVGAGHHGRKYDELKEALGLFAKFLPVRVALQSSARFNEILMQLAQASQDVNAWQDFFSWEMLNGKLDEAAPFLPFCFDFIESGEKFAAGATTFSVLQHDVCVDRFHLKLTGVRQHDALRLELHYDANLYAAEDAQRFVAQFQTLLESATTRPHAAICELNILPAEERQRLLFDFNDTAAEYPKDRCIHHVIEEQARREPDRVAVIFNEQVLTYGALNARANQLAHHLLAMGVGPNVLVGICLERSLEMIIGVLAILKAGGAYLPLDPAYPKERLEFMLTDTQAPVVLTKKSTIENFQLKTENLKLQFVYLDVDGNSIAKKSQENLTVNVIPENLVYIIYTSGSTGKPKGVMISHQDLIISNLARIAYFKQPVHKFLLLSSLSFDSSVVGIFWTLCEGGALFLVPEAQQKNMVELTEIVEAHQISHLLTLPSLYALILEYAKTQQINCLQTVIVAGEACPKKMVDQHKETLPDTALFSEYGATETTVFSSVYDCLQQTLNLAPVGDPIANAQMYVLDANQQPQPLNIPGEVYFGGDALAKGYWKRPDLTAEKFIPHPFSSKPGERLYKSGDLARHLPNGDIEFLGRIDNQVKIRGFRIELEEIEAVIGQHPSVREVAVEAHASATLASTALSTSKRLIGYVALRPEEPASIAELRHYLAERLPDYMVPAQFVKLDMLPKNPNGKIDRRALPDPGEERPELEENFVAAQTVIEKKLAEIWAEVLRVAKVGIHDNFFELGGDSILSIQIISKANRAGLRFTPVQLFQHQTIAELAKVTGAAQTIHAEQHVVTGALPLTPIQRWFFEKELPAPAHWNVSLLLEIRGEVTEAHFRRAAQKLLEQHDALRMRYTRDAGWQQTIVDVASAAAPFDRVDLSALSGEAQLAAIEKQTKSFQAQLNLAHGPLMRFVLFERGAGHSPYLLWVLHHLVCDIVSWRIMLEDLQTLLEQLRRNAPLQLPAKTTSFKYWAEQLAEYAQSPNVRGELDYWLSVIPTQPPALPFDCSNDLSVNTEESTGTIKLALDENETRALLQEVPKIYNTQINDVLLTALAQAFAEWTGEPSVLIDMEGHGREDIFTGVDLSRTVGWFTIFYPVLLKLENAADPGAALRSVKEQLRRIPNRGFNYSLLRYWQRNPEIAAKMQRLPAAQINFNYLGQFDQTLQESSLFGLVQETNICDRSPAGIRSHVLEIVGTVIRGCLQIEWSYSENLHRRETIAKLAQNFMAQLRAIIQHGQAADAKDFSASDFADFSWDQNDLENIAAAIARSKN